jgi:type I restriction enzyme, S subunit
MSSKTKTTSTKEEAKPALVPKLRFPEFRGAEGWSRQTLGSVASFFKGKGLPKSAIVPSGARPCIHYGELFTEYSENIGEIRSRTDVEGDLFLSVENDVLMPTSDVTPGGLAKACNLPRDGIILGGDILVIRADRNSVNGEFLARYIRHLKTKVLQLVSGSTVYHLYASSMEKLDLAFPSRAEQQKIAECLSSVDELMAAQARKVGALKTHKKGLMQQLFPREGETQPRLRFPEFQDAGEWVVKKLEEIGRVIRGASPRPKGDPRYYGGPIPRLMVQDVTRDGKWVTPQIDSLTEEGAKLSRPCPAGTLTIVCSGAVGVVSFLAVDACIHDGFLALVDIDESLASKDFLFHRLSTLREQFERGATHGGVFTNLTTTGVDQLEIAYPVPDEQQRIATCLSSLDALITAETQKLEALKTHKKGLMQQLFPSLEQVEA